MYFERSFDREGKIFRNICAIRVILQKRRWNEIKLKERNVKREMNQEVQQQRFVDKRIFRRYDIVIDAFLGKITE